MRTPRWLQRERMEAFEGHSNAFEVSLLCKEAEEIKCPALNGGGGDEGGEIDVDDDVQTQEQYLQVLSIIILLDSA